MGGQDEERLREIRERATPCVHAWHITDDGTTCKECGIAYERWADARVAELESRLAESDAKLATAERAPAKRIDGCAHTKARMLVYIDESACPICLLASCGIEKERRESEEREVERLDAIVSEGHDAPCFCCGEPCDSTAGDPGAWPIGLCIDESAPGVTRWCHRKCVVERLQLAEAAERRVGEVERIIGVAETVLGFIVAEFDEQRDADEAARRDAVGDVVCSYDSELREIWGRMHDALTRSGDGT